MSMHYGIWHESWQACCRLHKIEWSAIEEERVTEAAKQSYYQQTDSRANKMVDVVHELGRRADMHPNDVQAMIDKIKPPGD